jgi:hypothetical protein
MPLMVPFQVGVAEEAFCLDDAAPVDVQDVVAVDGSISTSSTQPEAISPGIVASISRQLLPPSLDSWTTCWSL